MPIPRQSSTSSSNEHASCDVDLAAEHVLGRRRRCRARCPEVGRRGAARVGSRRRAARSRRRRSHDRLAPPPRHRARARTSATDLDAEPFELPGVPGEVVEHLRACRLLPGEAPLPAELGRTSRPARRDGRARRSRAPPRVLPGRRRRRAPGTASAAGGEPVAAPLRLAPDRRVDQARDPVVAGPAAPAQLVARDARADPLGVSGAGLGDEMRIGDLAAHDRHHVGVTGSEHGLGVGRRADVALGLHDGVAHDGLERRRRRLAEPSRIQRRRHQRVEVEVAAGPARDVVHQRARVVPGDDLLQLGLRQRTVGVRVEVDGEADDEVVATRAA